MQKELGFVGEVVVDDIVQCGDVDPSGLGRERGGGGGRGEGGASERDREYH